MIVAGNGYKFLSNIEILIEKAKEGA